MHLLAPESGKVIPVLNYDIINGQRASVPWTRTDMRAAPMDQRVIEHGAQLILRAELSQKVPGLVAFGDQNRPSASLMFVPMRNGNKVIGTLSIQSYVPQAYDPDALNVLQALADFCAGAMERIQAAAALRQSEERFSKAFRATPVAIAISTLAESRVVDVNEGFLRLFGFQRDEVIGRAALELDIWTNSEDRAELLRLLEEKRSVRDKEYRFRTKTGDDRGVLVSAEIIELGNEPCMLFIAYDLTERLHLETQLRHAQKLEAVGRLAAGIAHDFNNIMTVIQGYASYQLSTAQPDGELAESLRQISEAAERAAGLTRQLLTFSRKQVLHLRSLNLNEAIRQVTRTLSRVLGEDILLECHLEAELPGVWADVGMIEQLITNLAVNARDAMPQGGRFVVRTASVEVEADAASVHAEARPGSFVCLSIADTGSGMDAVTLSRIFEPFFTTKDVGQGSGLGLATVHGIVKQHQGWIDTSSQTGRGTTFKIFLPIARQPAEERPPISRPSAHLADSKTILVVEDETSVRRFVCHLLRQEGFQLAEVASGVDALQWWKENGRNADLLLTDIRMPGGVSGRQLAEQLHSEKPGLKVILTSGYSLETTERDGILEKGFHFLAKPYPPANLIELVRCCLDSDGP